VKLPKRVEPYPLLGTMAEVHESLRELQDQVNRISGRKDASVFTGITAAIGSILEKAGEGTSKIVSALGSSIKSVTEGVGSMSKDIISSSGDALAETITAGGSAVKDVEEGGADVLKSIFGGIPGILGMVALLIVVLLIARIAFLRYKRNRQHEHNDDGENDRDNDDNKIQQENWSEDVNMFPKTVDDIVNDANVLAEVANKLLDETRF